MWFFADIKAREVRLLLLNRHTQAIRAKATSCARLLIQRHHTGQHKTPAGFPATGDAARKKTAALSAAHLSGWVG
jgi:hypothetical protein